MLTGGGETFTVKALPPLQPLDDPKAAEIVRLCLEGPESATASGFVLPRTGGAPPFCAGYLR
jgi:hypothetical protein